MPFVFGLSQLPPFRGMTVKVFTSFIMVRSLTIPCIGPVDAAEPRSGVGDLFRPQSCIVAVCFFDNILQEAGVWFGCICGRPKKSSFSLSTELARYILTSAEGRTEVHGLSIYLYDPWHLSPVAGRGTRLSTLRWRAYYLKLNCKWHLYN